MTDDIVYVVDDDEASRESTAALIMEMGVPVQTFASAEEFLQQYDGHRPACLVSDVRMKRMSGLELQEELQRRGHNIATIILTAYAETPVTVRAIKNGAFTLLEKPCRQLALWDAVRTALADDALMHQRDARRQELTRRLESLTPAEQKVLEYIVAGEANKVIAQRLDISIRTVEVRRHAIFDKMMAQSVAELVRMTIDAAHES